MTPIKISELERLAKDAADSTESYSYQDGEIDPWHILDASQPLTISRLCEALRIAVDALDKSDDQHHYEGGYTPSTIRCAEALTKIQSLVDLS